jgi:hypothetical protein
MISEAGARRAISTAGHGANVSQIARHLGHDRKTIRLCLPVTFVYAGIGADRGALLAGPRGDQVAGRFTLIPAGAFSPGQERVTLIAAMEGALRPCRHKDGTLVTLPDYLHRRTRGLIGSLLWLIRDAAGQAIPDGTERITRKSPGQIALGMTAQAPPARTGSARR